MVPRTDRSPHASSMPLLTPELAAAVREIVDVRVMQVLARYEKAFIEKATDKIGAMINLKIAEMVRRRNQRDGDGWKNNHFETDE